MPVCQRITSANNVNFMFAPCAHYLTSHDQVRCLMLQVFTQVFQMLLGPISLIFCGHLGDPIKLDGAALAVSVRNSRHFGG